MKTKTRRLFAAGLMSACVVTACAGVSMLTKSTAYALADGGQEAASATNYFYDNLVTGNNQEYTLAKRFYEALDEMYEDGDFIDGRVEYDITAKQIVTSDEVKAWVENGELTIPKAFSAARDAYLTDHPEIFYINFYKLTISAGRTGGVYSAYIDTGREANAYYDQGFTTQSAVNGAIDKFNKSVDKLVSEALTAEEENDYTERDVFLARYVNKYLVNNVDYDYVAYENRSNADYVAAANINTAYGGLVEGKAVCGGYSTAYKVIMDKLGIPCITVSGYSKQRFSDDKPDSNVYHMWNYVWLGNPTGGTAQAASYADGTDGEWYSVDCTWNKAVLNATADAQQHINDGRISSSGYELKYPKLSPHNYGSTGNTYGLQQSIDYEESDTKDEDGNPVVKTRVTVSYNGKSAKRLLEEDGLHIAYRVYGMIEGKLAWTRWSSLEINRQFMGLDVDDGIRWYDNGNETRFPENTHVCYYQLAVFEDSPDTAASSWTNTKVYYSEDLLNNITAVEMGEVKTNRTYGTYTPAPYIQGSKPTHTVEQVISDGMSMSGDDAGKMKETSAQIYEITYDEELHILDPDKPIGIEFISDHPNAKDYARFLEFESENTPGKMVTVEIVQRAKNSGDPTLVYNTLRFKFAPSLMYEHNREGYFISFTNVGSAKVVQKYVGGVLTTVTSDKAPNPVYYSFGRLYRACPACFNYDGRLWVECCAQPTLVSNSDLSVDNFTDENGSTFSENERSQMMLVAETADTSTVDTMLDEISGDNKINVNKEEIIKSETYDIALQICGKYPKIPDGSYVKIGLGFPKGYGPESEGVTFKLYHRKHLGGDSYIIEEVPCVVTKFGIVATVTSFSPYMVAVVDEEKATDKTVYATIDGNGGKLLKEDGEVKSLKEGDSCTYTINPDNGYQLYTVTLNGANVTDQVVNGKLTLNYADLANNNEIEIKYIANGAVKRVLNNNLISPVKVVLDGDSATPVSEVISTPDYLKIIEDNPANNNTGLIVGIIIAVVVVAAGAVALVFVLRKRGGKQTATAEAKPAKAGKAEKAEKPAEKRVSNAAPAKQQVKPAAAAPAKQSAAKPAPAKLPAAKPAAQPAAKPAPAKLPTANAKPAAQPAQPKKLPTAQSVKQPAKTAQPAKLPTKKDK